MVRCRRLELLGLLHTRGLVLLLGAGLLDAASADGLRVLPVVRRFEIRVAVLGGLNARSERCYASLTHQLE